MIFNYKIGIITRKNPIQGATIKKNAVYLFVITCLLSGCVNYKFKDIDNYNNLEQPIEKNLTLGVGGTVFRLNKSADLPNIYGKADIYGGKVDKGFTELKLKGIKDDGTLVLQITEINKSSTETTMDRYLKNNSTISSTNTVKIGDDSNPDITVLEFNPSKEKTLTVGGITVTFIEVSTYNVKYQLKSDMQNL